MLSLVCAVFFSVISATSFYSPLFLAAMAMERYIAVCNPLRHVQICSNKWVCFVLCIIFFTGEIPNVVVFSLFTSEQPLSAFFTYKYCTREVFINSPSQNTARIVFYLMFFVPVWIVIIYTYFCIMIEAKRAAGDSSSISKAQKTVFLHGIQMLLCMTYFCLPLLELCFSSAPAYVLHHTRFISYFLTNLLPKILSPLIYGARDENFKKHLKFHLSCFSNNVRPLNVNSK
ncbi:odorant receptor 131-2-like [Polypterus senegalus]|uniref:odorant receptor 131-2-like n=1 Tax=Polypterus senegalus TaxID=55291 RepID=UPI00196655BA|nr:odorant receptor 131-2-like [Polypterus senegalus]